MEYQVVNPYHLQCPDTENCSFETKNKKIFQSEMLLKGSSKYDTKNRKNHTFHCSIVRVSFMKIINAAYHTILGAINIPKYK